MEIQYIICTVQQSLRNLNVRLSLDDAEITFTDLQNVIKSSDDKSIILIQSYAKRYYDKLLEEKKEGLPESVLVRDHQ